MKKLKQNLFIILLSLSFAAVALPPDMQADRYLLQAEKALKGKDMDYKKAAEYMDKIMALKDQHNLELPIEFYFKYANILLESIIEGYKDFADIEIKADEAFAAINHYLIATGKSGANYAEALDLYEKATFWQLVQAKNKSKVEQLIKLGANINVKDKRGVSPLHYAAAYNNNPDVVRALIQAGVDINSEDDTESTPLHYATGNNNSDIIRVLIKAGAYVNARARNGKTPLYHAMEYIYFFTNNPNTAIALIQAGANLNNIYFELPDYHDRVRILTYAIAAIGDVSLIKALILAGADELGKADQFMYTWSGKVKGKFEGLDKMSDNDIIQVRRWLKNPSLLRK